MTRPNDHLIDQLFATLKIIKENFRSQGVAGLSFGQLKTLHYIKSKTNPNMKDIADELGITPPSATSLIDQFVLHGLVKRVYAREDRRMVRLVLTAKGKTYLSEHYNNMTEKIKKLLANLNDTQIKNLQEILEVLLLSSKK
jgi:DNA-binding MarR family transcriptional regulator